MLIAFGLGTAVGAIMALSGAGGGILAVPLLVFGMHQSLAQAGPIGLLAVGLAAWLGAALGLKAGIVRYKATLLMGSSGMLLSPAGLWLASRTDNRGLSILFALTLLFVAYRSFQSAMPQSLEEMTAKNRRSPCVVSAQTGRFIWNSRCARVLAMAGSVAGLLSGLLGVGGGFVMVPALHRYSNLEMRSVVATSLGVIALVSTSGVMASAVAGNLNWAIAIPFSAGALAGMLGGRQVSNSLSAAFQKKCFAVLSALVAAGLIAKALT
jgi:uncharacterized membrane protein YfcA